MLHDKALQDKFDKAKGVLGQQYKLLNCIPASLNIAVIRKGLQRDRTRESIHSSRVAAITNIICSKIRKEKHSIESAELVWQYEKSTRIDLAK
jgi:hypothetical protein